MQTVALYFCCFSSCVLPFCAWTQSGTLLVYLCQSTAVLACLSAKWDELFLCSDKADLEHQPGLLGPFVLLGSFLWDSTKWLPAEAKICSLISMTVILLLILLIPLSIFNSSVSWWLQSRVPLPLCSCFSEWQVWQPFRWSHIAFYLFQKSESLLPSCIDCLTGWL